MNENRLIYMTPEGPTAFPLSLSENFEMYPIQAGDSFWKLTNSYYAIIDDHERKICEKIIKEHNPTINPNSLQIGEKIKLPSKEYVFDTMSIYEEGGRRRSELGEYVDLTKVKDINKEMLSDAEESLSRAKKYILRNVTYRGKKLTSKDLNSLDHYYIPLMIKESRLDNDAKSRASAIGYFGITKSAAADVEKDFEFEGKLKKEKNIIYETPINNCIYGILNLYLSRNKYAEQSRYDNLISEDKDKIALMMHNKGPTHIGALWDLLNPSSYDDFQKKLSDALSKQLNVSRENKVVLDESYGVYYKESAAIKKYIQLLNSKNWTELDKKFLINGNSVRDIKVAQVGEVLRYARVISAISQGDFGFTSQYDIVQPSEFDDISNEEESLDNDNVWKIEKISRNYSLWGMSNDLMKHCKSEGVESCQDLDYFERENTRSILQEMIMEYNFKYNPSFKNINDDVEDLPEGLGFMIPDSDYTEAYLESDNEDKELENEAHDSVSDEVNGALDTIRRDLPLYINDSNGDLEREGNEFIKNTSGFDLDSLKLHHPSRKSRSSNNVKFIILHSTAAASSRGTINNDKAHYLVERDGTIVYVVDRDDYLNHAGKMSGKPGYRAMWNGERDPSQSIGIEVQADKGKKWTEAQYKSMKKLVYALGDEYNLQKKDVLAHSQVAASEPWGRGRKSDPYGLDFSKLDLPNNYQLVDLDVVAKRIKPNVSEINAHPYYTNASKEGLLASAKLSERPEIVKLAKDIKKIESESYRTAMSEKYDMKKYKVKKGEGMISIARKNNSKVSLIAKANGISENESLQIGQTLYVPVKKS